MVLMSKIGKVRPLREFIIMAIARVEFSGQPRNKNDISYAVQV
jgi:hypothetical protein